MGFRKIPTIYTLEFDDVEPLKGFVVRMRGLKIGRMRKVLALMGDDSSDESSIDGIVNELIANTVSWNLEDENGDPVPVTRETFDDLELDDVMAISHKWLDAITGPDPELGKDSSSGGSFPGRPLMMEAL